MKTVKSLQIAVTFERDKEIQYTLGSMLSKASKEGLFKISDLPNPQAPLPNIPRIAVTSKEFVMNISQERFDFFLTIPNHISHEPIKVISYAKTATKILCNFFMPHVNYLWCGVIFDLNYPYKVLTNHLNELFDKTLSINRKDKDIASFQLNYGYKENGNFINFIITEYRSFDFIKKLVPNEIIKLEDANLVEMGLDIKFDINNKPSIPHYAFEKDLEAILSSLIPLISKVYRDNNLEGIK
ncbi:MAG: hypothetical protein HQ557_17605 [Bacteroidetes bacterium]|nr:hypothetical protein [Bacteroidota bacterium]